MLNFGVVSFLFFRMLAVSQLLTFSVLIAQETMFSEDGDAKDGETEGEEASEKKK